MAQQIINVGATPNDGTGDPIRTAFIKSNNNFSQLYSRVQTTTPTALIGQIGDQAGMYAYDSTYFYYCFANYDGSSVIWGQVPQVGNVATQVTGSWTLSAGTNTVSLTVPVSGTYSIWVNGNIPNGVVTYTATVVVASTDVPVVGSSYGWYDVTGAALELTAIPNQIVGTLNNISTAVVVTTTANVFTFDITNNSGNSAVVNYGYTKL
jgi:hypothetical protein